jgi:diguanylate cyclase (GGDEF)-like protein/PAS domain S-box-containing protein
MPRLTKSFLRPLLLGLKMLGLAGLLALSPSVKALDAITLQLKWEHAFQFAGYYAALEKGYYRQAGLEVTLREAKPGQDSLFEVISGNAAYGVSNSSLLLARKSGQPVVVLAAIFQHSPLILITAKSKTNDSIHNLTGKRLMIEPQSDELFAFLKLSGIPLSRVTQVPHTFNPQDLINGKVDAISAYITAEPYFLKRAGFDYQSHSPRSAGIDFYGDNLFTTEAELKAHPARVKAFREASLRGWEYAMTHQAEIADLIHRKYNATHPSDYYLFEAEQMMNLMRPDLIEIGYMSPGRWRHIADTYADIGLLPKDFPLDGFIYAPDAKTNLKPFYLTFVLLLLISVFAAYIFRLNRRLNRTIAEKTKIHDELIESETLFRSLSANLAAGIFVVSHGRIKFINPIIAKLSGYSEAELIGMKFLNLIHPEHQPMIVDYGARRAHGEAVPDPYECKFITRENQIRWLEVSVTQMELNGEISSIGTIFDITDRKQGEEKLELAAKVFTHAREGIMITDAFNRIIEVNDTFCKITGYSRAEIQGKNPRILSSGRQSPDFYRAMWHSLNTTGSWVGELWNRRKDGEFYAELKTISTVQDAHGKVQNFVALFSDITQIKAHQQRLEHVAHYDILTNLPNRLLLSDRLQQAIIRSQRQQTVVGVAYLDLDGFKAVNDSHGHDVGDELLIIVAQRMKATLREGDTLARIGGDEFIAVLSDLDYPETAEPLLMRLLEAAAAPVLIDHLTLQVSASIGVAIYPYDGTDSDQLIRCADHAMYQAKQMGKNQFAIFVPEA